MTTTSNTWGLLVAATVALTGLTACATPTQSPTSQQAVAGTGSASAIASAMLDERDLGDIDYMIEAARYQVAAAPDGTRAQNEDAKQRAADRLAELKAAVEARLAEKAETAKKAKEAHDNAPEVTEEDGDKTKNFSFEETRTTGNGGTRTRTVESTVTRNGGGVVFSFYKATQTVSGSGNERSRVLSRTREVANDGTVTITFHREHTFKDGRVFTADWTKTIGPDGGVSGSGQLSHAGKNGETKTVELKFGGTEGQPQAETGDGEEEVTLPPKGKAYGKGGKPVATEED